MALTISTGFVVDDAIVMIENIVRYHRRRRNAAASGAERRGADRLHDRFADGVADRGADSVALHGRHRGPAVPRVRDHAECDDSGVGSRLADAYADDVLAVAQATNPRQQRGRFYRGLGACVQKVIDFYGATLRWVLQRQTATLLVAAPRWCSRSVLYVDCAERIFPGAGHRRHSGHLGGAADHFLPRDGREAAGAWRDVILKDPAVESLSSFIGVDGTNTTLNSGRMLINLKPLE